MFSLDKHEIQLILINAALGLIVGAVYTQVFYLSRADAQGAIWLGMGIGATIGISISFFELVLVGRPDAPLRKLGFWKSLLARTLTHILFIIISIFAWQYLYQITTGVPIVLLNADVSDTVTDLGFSFSVVLVIIFYMQMRLFIGGRTLRNLIFGKYHTPQVEERIFMVCDMVGSTAYAQKEGDVRFHRLLNEFFALLDEPIHRRGGEVHSYVGDALFAVWPVSANPGDNSRVLQALSEAQTLIQRSEDRFQQSFNTHPQLRVAIHKGSVVVGETGYRKRQITYLGNTVNTVARIESLTKTGIGTFLASSEFVSITTIPENISIIEIGEFDIKGVTDPIELHRIEL